MTPQPCHYCNVLVCRDEQGALAATHPSHPTPWECFGSPTGRHMLLASDLCTCGRNLHSASGVRYNGRLTHADSCTLAAQYRERHDTTTSSTEEGRDR